MGCVACVGLKHNGSHFLSENEEFFTKINNTLILVFILDFIYSTINNFNFLFWLFLIQSGIQIDFGAKQLLSNLTPQSRNFTDSNHDLALSAFCQYIFEDWQTKLSQ